MERNADAKPSINVKLMLMLGLFILCGAAVFGIRTRREPQSEVGTSPGDIGTSGDILASAKGRRHDLAIFAAG